MDGLWGRVVDGRVMKRAKREQTDDACTARRGSDAGFTLIEIVATIAIMAIVIAPVLDSVITTIRASRTSGDLSQIETVLQNAADRVNRAPKGCDYAVYAEAAALAEGWVSGQVTTQQQHYVPAMTSTQPGTWATGACTGPTPTDLIVQLVTITVTSPDGKIHKTIEVVKSDV
jgi:prepilin-type N-terminal cleavage/methylation domain-containing protein